VQRGLYHQPPRISVVLSPLSHASSLCSWYLPFWHQSHSCSRSSSCVHNFPCDTMTLSISLYDPSYEVAKSSYPLVSGSSVLHFFCSVGIVCVHSTSPKFFKHPCCGSTRKPSCSPLAMFKFPMLLHIFMFPSPYFEDTLRLPFTCFLLVHLFSLCFSKSFLLRIRPMNIKMPRKPGSSQPPAAAGRNHFNHGVEGSRMRRCARWEVATLLPQQFAGQSR